MKKNISRIIIGLLALLLVFTLYGCQSKEKTFSKEGMSIVLDESFQEQPLETQTAYYESKDKIVTILKEEFSVFTPYGMDAEDVSLQDYAQMVVDNNGLTAKVEEKDGLVQFVYEKSVDGSDITYLATVHKGIDAFWLVQFACESKNYSKFYSIFVGYAKSFKG